VKIAACFYINLDERSDRREHTELQLAALGSIARERWPAVRPTRETLAHHADTLARGVQGYVQELLSDPRTVPHYYGVLGCYLSHLTLLQQIAERFGPGDGAVLVFEDDVALEPGFVSALRDRVASADLVHRGWDLMRLDCWGRRRRRDRVCDGVYRLSTPWQAPAHYNGSHALVYRPERVAGLLSALAARPIKDFDGFWDEPELTATLEHYVVYTGKCSLRKLPSDVRPSRRSPARALLSRVRGQTGVGPAQRL
jgi:GR25 family glycosyltransferase involved in LPS biosynthesis